jgi:hypothetical protein
MDFINDDAVVLLTVLMFVVFTPLHESLLQLDAVADLYYKPRQPPTRVARAYDTTGGGDD